MLGNITVKIASTGLLFVALVSAGCHLMQPKPKEEFTQVKGTILSLNYTPHGDIDGFVLESGEVIHVGPKEAKELNLYKGEKITGVGHMRKSPNGTPIIEAHELNGQRLMK